MQRLLSALLVASAAVAHAEERNYTLRGDGWFDGGNRRFARLDLREARFTLHDDGRIAVTLFVRDARYLVRGRWERRGRGPDLRIALDEAFGTRASGNGTLRFDASSRVPEHLTLDGRTSEGSFRATLDDSGNDPRWDDRREDGLGRGTRLSRPLDLAGAGDGLLRHARARDGRVEQLQATLRTNGEVRLELERPTRGTLRGEIVDIDGDRIRIRVQELLGSQASGELDLIVRDGRRVERLAGAGNSREGSWQLDFTDRGREWDRWDDDRDRFGFGRFDARVRGNGWLRQEVGPDLTFDRLRVRLESDRSAVLVLEGRRQSLELRGRWRSDGDDVRIDLTSINEMQARGRVTLARDGDEVRRLAGDGRTNLGRFELRFDR